MIYKIIGVDRGFHKECWGTFDNFRECAEYLDFLKRTSPGETVKFTVEKEYDKKESNHGTENTEN